MPARPSARPSTKVVLAATIAASGLLGVAGTAIAATAPSRAPIATRHRHNPRKGRRHPAAPLRLTGATPSTASTGIAGTATLRLSFSETLAANTPDPTLSPATPGSWSVQGSNLVFRPSTAFIPLSAVTITVPGGTKGVRAKSGAHLSRATTEHFSVRNGSVLRLQQLLSLLQYSPLAFAQKGGAIAPSNTPAQIAALYAPPAGTFAWRNAGWPHQLVTMWHPGVDTVFTRGLIMSFQADHGLIPNGNVTASLWSSLVQALASHSVNTGGYNYALASKTPPESLTVYHDGRVVLHTPVNTGIAQTPTPDGTFPVYTRLRNQVMKGTNPNGTKYADPVQFVAYFYHSDAVHFMPRADYGIPQSLGCIELPYTAAETAWPYLAYGTLVTVDG